MKDTDYFIKNKKINIDRLLSFGFVKKGKNYIYSAGLINGQLEMTVTITKDGKLSTEIKDTLSGELYILHKVSNSHGVFVGKVREEYNSILSAVIENCFESDVFKSGYSKKVIQYVKEKYYNELEFLWTKFPDNAVFRRRDSGKWYAALLVLQRQKLGLNEDGTVEIIDLRMKPEDIDKLIDNKHYFPGYHMNKKHWFTICLDGSVPIEKIFHYIDNSYNLAVK